MTQVRLEEDLLGELEVPAEAYYGVQTLRALRNFDFTGIPISHYQPFIHSLVLVKKAAAQANLELGLLEEPIANAIDQACDEILAGQLLDAFVVDIIQGGAGTSSNMNANEVIANRALEILGHAKGQYAFVHPNQHVNMSQSTNDVFPTALRITLWVMLDGLVEGMRVLQEALAEKEEEFKDVLKIGRTQLQDAVPMTLGQEFGAYAVMVGEDIQRVIEARNLVREINLGGTAIGTGLNAPRGYALKATQILAELSGIPVVKSHDLVEATQDTGAYVQLSGVLKRFAVKLSKICNDLRLLSSGPRAGFNEIDLPPMQPGSSIMPGKVNPVIPEVVNQVAYEVIGNDMTITMAAEAGQLELNVMEPVIAFSLFSSIQLLRNACSTLTERCIRGITANRERCLLLVKRSIGLVTALVPVLGYERASAIAKQALNSGDSVYEIVLQSGELSQEQLDVLLSPENMARQAGSDLED